MGNQLRMGVIGLGAMGRNHARIAPRLYDLVFVGGVDPDGDNHLSLGAYPLYRHVSDLLSEGVDAVVLAVPAKHLEKWAVEMAEQGVHTLIEKPLAEDLPSARRVREAFKAADVTGAVGYVERFNPALQELKRRLELRELGRIFSISTRRVGPYPLRMSEVGVVSDLATHDIDIVRWLGFEFGEFHASTVSKLGRPHEDLAEVMGRLDDGTILTMSVNWLTPRKERSVTVLGERGAFIADLLAADLTFYANAAVPVEWEEMARLKGVAEGDVVKYALKKHEPLQSELEGFRDACLGKPGAQFASLDDGVRTVEIAERIVGRS